MSSHRWRLRLIVVSSIATAVVHMASAVEPPVRALVVYGGHGFPTNEFLRTIRELPGVASEFAVFPEAAARLRPGLERKSMCWSATICSRGPRKRIGGTSWR